MALVPIKLTHSQRSACSIIFLVLLSMQGICGIICSCIGFFILFYIKRGQFSYIKNDLDSLFVFLSIISILIFSILVTGFKYNRNLSAQPTNSSTTRVHWVWLSLCLTVILFLLFYEYLLVDLEKQLTVSQTLVVDHGLTRYYTDKSWKGIMDNLQQFHECCGVQHYTDWYRTPWLHYSKLPQDQNILDKYSQANGLVLVPIVPSSCCKFSDPLCGEKSLFSNKSITGWDEIKPTNPSIIHTEGCLPKLLSLVINSILVIRILMLFTNITECISIIISRYLYTSTRNAIVMGDPYGTVSGWLYGRGDLCCNCGKTVPEQDSEIFRNSPINSNDTSIIIQKEFEGTENIKHKKYNKIKSKIKCPSLKIIKKIKETKYCKKDKASDNEIRDVKSVSPGRLSNFLVDKRSNASSKMSVNPDEQRHITEKMELLPQSGDESDLSGYEIKSLYKDKRLSEKFRSRYLNSQSKDQVLGLGQNSPKMSQDCIDCDQYAFSSEDKKHQKESKLSKTIDSQRNLDKQIRSSSLYIPKSQTTFARDTFKGKTIESIQTQPPDPPPLNPKDFDSEIVSQVNHVHFNLNEGNIQKDFQDSTKSQNTSKSKQSKIDQGQLVENKSPSWLAMKSVTQSYNVQTQTSQGHVVIEANNVEDQWQKAVDKPAQAQEKDSGSVVFRNYRIPPPRKYSRFNKSNLGK